MGMGLRRAPELWSAAVRPHSHLRTSPTSSSSTSASASTSSPVAVFCVSSLSAVLVVVASALVALGSLQGTVAFDLGDRQQPTCDLAGCWALFNRAQETLGVDFDMEPRETPINPTRIQNHCIAFRTFSQCIRRNISGSCVGDLSYHSVEKGLESQMKTFNCSQRGRVFDPSEAEAGGPPRAPTLCTYPGEPARSQCALFGDPHLQTFDGRFQTCRILGTWPLIDNEFFTVQVTNDAVGVTDGSATATTKLTVLIKQHDKCADGHYVTYQAQAGPLPGALPGVFDDGRQHFGSQRSVMLREIDPNRHVEIYMRYLNTTLIVRHLAGRYLSLAVSMPADLVARSLSAGGADPDRLQLCLRGCPLAEKINVTSVLSLRQVTLYPPRPSRGRGRQTALQTGPMESDPNGWFPSSSLHGQPQSSSPSSSSSAPASARGPLPQTVTRETAAARCRAQDLVDFYLDSCVFDLLSTGDANLTLAAHHAQEDLLRLDPDSVRRRPNRTSLDIYAYEPIQASSGAASSLRMATNLHYIHRTMFVLISLGYLAASAASASASAAASAALPRTQTVAIIALWISALFYLTYRPRAGSTLWLALTDGYR